MVALFGFTLIKLCSMLFGVNLTNLNYNFI